MKIILFILGLCVAIQSLHGQHKCEKDFLKTSLLKDSIETSVLLIWFPINAGAQSTLSVCSADSGLPLQRHCSYDRQNGAKWENNINEHVKLINCSSIPRQCFDEPFEHNYIMKNGVLEAFNNTWKTTAMMERGDLETPCLLKTGLPLTRRCEYNPLLRSVQWELLSPAMRTREFACLRQTREDVITYSLNTLYQDVKNNKTEDKVEPKKVVEKMTELLKDPEKVRIPADIKISSEILKIVTKNNTNPEIITGVLKVTDIFMATDPIAIIKSEEVNAATTLLETVDDYLQSMAKVLVPTNHCENVTDGIFTETSESTTIFYINPSCSNISGVAIFNKRVQHHQDQRYDENTGNYYRFLYLNHTLDQILSEPELRLAAYFPLSLWNKLKTETSTRDNDTVLTFIIFQNDVLFVNPNGTHQTRQNVLEIKIPNYSGELPEDVPFVLSYRADRDYPQKKPNCSYWNYSAWITTGLRTEYKTIFNNSLLICHSTHLTHYAALFKVAFKPPNKDKDMLTISHDLILDYISIWGCGLSLVGLSCIWLTAVCFRSFRVEPSNKVLMNVCFVLFLLTIYFLLLNLPQLWKPYMDRGNALLICQVTGAFLHYIVIVLFLWMLIIAIMQYQRYVSIFGYDRPSNYVLKYAIAAWVLPLIPAGVVFYLDPNTYMPSAEQIQNNNDICYPSGESLKYGVILPMGLILVTNLAIFIYIFYSLHRSLNKFKHHRDRNNMIIQIRLSVFLFFLLGISWIFGILAHLGGRVEFAYLFCVTSTLQGFVLFIYSIVIDKATRSAWLILCCAKSYNTKENTSQVKYIDSSLWK